jgi:AcrR family transcriptional regulator
MPKALLPRHEVVDRLMGAVREHGYDGASLAQLSHVTGLGKSSLYHYFPGGKEDMVRAVLERLEAQLTANLFAPLGGDGSVAERIEMMVAALDTFYRGGREACVLANLVLGSSREKFRPELQRIFSSWIDAIASALVETGLSPTAARERAADAVIRFEGALILTGALGDLDVFARTLRALPAHLLGTE